jgi:hypothetical protein
LAVVFLAIEDAICCFFNDPSPSADTVKGVGTSAAVALSPPPPVERRFREADVPDSANWAAGR